MLLIGAAGSLLGGLLIWHACRDWPQAPGKIIRLKVHPDAEQRRLRVFDLEYEFTVHGKRLSGSALSPFAVNNRMHVWLAWWKERQYSVGQAVLVMHDPNDAQRHFLEKPELIGCLGRFAGFASLGAWMVYLFFRFRKRSVPKEVIAAKENQASIDPDIFVNHKDPIALRGISSHSPLGSLLSSWPKCRAALVVDQSQFVVVPGPYTKLGYASSLLTVILLVWWQSFSVLLVHFVLEAKEIISRRIAWNNLCAGRYDELDGADLISDVIVYGFDFRRNRLWYRIKRRRRDEFIEIAENDERAAQFFALVANEYLRMSDEGPTD